MKLKFWENIDYEHKMFIIFLIVNIFLWLGVAMIRTVLPTDALEGIYWGSLHDFGTPKHPPLAGWITYWVYNAFKTDLSVYVVSQAFILLGFIYIYKIARIFLEPKRAILSTMMLEGCWVYGYIVEYYGFNPDVVLLGLLPFLTYHFYKCMNSKKWYDWVILGVIVGICFLNKYQTLLIFVPMLIWAIMFRREVFKSKWFYISALIAFLIFLPHLAWMIKYEFFPLMYFEGEFADNSWLTHITSTLLFAVMQFALIAGTIAMFVSLKLLQKSPFKLIDIKKDEKTWFLILFSLIPLLIHLTMGICGGGTMRPRWGFEFMYLIGIIMFYFFPTKDISKKEFNFITGFAYFAMLVIFIVMGTLLSVEKNYRSRYPVAHIYNDMQTFWNESQKTPLKYLGGYIEWTLPLTIYQEPHPQIILDTHGYKNPWIDETDLKASGILIIDRTVDDVVSEAKKSCPYLEDDFKIEPKEYKFTVTNAFGQEREYIIHYFIVPPLK